MFNTMKYSNNIISACFSLALGMSALTGCEGGELFDVNAPDWLSDKIQEIEDSKNDNQDEIVLEGMMEDVYTIGSTDYSSGCSIFTLIQVRRILIRILL